MCTVKRLRAVRTAGQSTQQVCVIQLRSNPPPDLVLIEPGWLQTLLLDLPPELLQREVLPLLSLQMWGALRLTCRALHALAEDAPDSVLHTAARHTLPSTHPVLGAQPRRQLALQRRVGQAIAADPSTWHWERVPHVPKSEARWLASFSLDWSKLATTSRDRVVVTDLHSNRQLLDLPVDPAGALSPYRGLARCAWTDDSAALFWYVEVEQRCRVSYFNTHTHQPIDLTLPTSAANCPECLPWVLPGCHALLLATRCHTCRQHHLHVVRASGALLSCSLPMMSKLDMKHRNLLAYNSSGGVAFLGNKTKLCIWQPGFPAVSAVMPSDLWSFA